MRKSISQELQMLREIAHFFLADVDCCFCHKPLIEDLQTTFGHRGHKPIKARLTVHHVNEDHDDNRPGNRRWSHQSCHKSYHARRILHKQSVKRALSLAG